jgi:hypothetical protein
MAKKRWASSKVIHQSANSRWGLASVWQRNGKTKAIKLCANHYHFIT